MTSAKRTDGSARDKSSSAASGRDIIRNKGYQWSQNKKELLSKRRKRGRFFVFETLRPKSRRHVGRHRRLSLIREEN